MKLHVSAAPAALALAALTVAGAPGLANPAVPQPAATGDAVAGGRLFVQCRACHTVGVGDPSGAGPNLRGVVGARAGARPGYAYSPAMTKAGLTWDAATLDRFLTKPSALVPGTRMAFPGVAAPKARADLIAYLATLRK